MKEKTAHDLWQDYQFLTKEMKKFLAQQDMELFNNLMNQRDHLQSLLEQTPDNGFQGSAEGRCLLNEIRQANQKITYELQLLMGSSKRQHQVSEAYGAASTTAVSRMSWQR